MAFPLPRGITPPEIEFLSEMELVTVVPRQRLEGLGLLSVSVICNPASIYLLAVEIYIPPLRIDIFVIGEQFCERDLTQIHRVPRKDFYRRSAQHSLFGLRSY